MKRWVGKNLILDIYNLDESFLKDRKELINFLNFLMKALNLEPFGKPLIKKIKTPKYHYFGFSIVQIITESHISLHTWPEYNYLALDIFSCKNFDENKAIEKIKKYFKNKIKIKFKKIERYIF
jgi:S-adenosylmethionine decarboxylase